MPEELIAQTPLEDRAGSRLLHVDLGQRTIEHRAFREAPTLLREGDLLVVNQTRVTAVRLYGHRPSGGKVEILLLKEVAPLEYEALTRPAKRLGLGQKVEFERGLRAEVLDDLGEGRKRLRFEGPADPLAEIEAQGLAPLPPYIREALSDRERYQTMFAASGGSAAAPTAALHFTPEIVEALFARGVSLAKVDLEVGLDTFRPIAELDLDKHPMHGERCRLSAETADKIASCKGRIVAVGTTTTRTLESFAVGPKRVEPGDKTTRLFIRPGYRFQIIDGMFTNFHMPRTTMLLMLAALAGIDLLAESYKAAVEKRYRFLSFGDSMLLL